MKNRLFFCMVTMVAAIRAEMSPQMQKAQKFFKTSGKAGQLLKKVNEHTPEGLARDMVRHVLDSVTSASNMGFHITALIGDRKMVVEGNDVTLDVLAKRYQCLQKDDAVLVKEAKDYDTSRGLNLSAGCPGVGCVNREAAFALFTRDLVYLTKPFIEGLVGKVVINEKGEATNKIESGLFLSLNQAMQTVLTSLTAEKKMAKSGSEVDVIAEKSRASWFSLMSQLKMLNNLSKMAEKVAVFFAQVYSVFVPAFDVVALVIGGDAVLDFIVIPESTKDVITIDDSEPGDFTIDDDMIEKDFNMFYAAMTTPAA